MANDDVREIQLGGKQLFFLFMTAVVLLVVVFLLGVSVGRGVRGTVGDAEATLAAAPGTAEPVRPVDVPPPTQTTPADKAYTDRLQGTTPAQPKAVDPVPTPPAETAKPQPTPPPPAAAPPAAETSKPAAPPPATANPAQTAPAGKPAGEGWVLQVGSFGTRANADKLAAQLKSKGYAAFVFDPGRGQDTKVRIGPFATRAEADKVAARYQRGEGTKPLITR